MKTILRLQNWAHQWKMVFNRDITKQAIEIVFSVKNNKPIHPPLSFNNIPVARVYIWTQHYLLQNTLEKKLRKR